MEYFEKSHTWKFTGTITLNEYNTLRFVQIYLNKEKNNLEE